MRRHPTVPATIAAATLALVVTFVLVWPAVSRYDANDVELAQSRLGPSLEHPLGTDQFGRDLLTRLATGGRTTLAIAGLALALILVIGVVYGTTAALAGGVVDSLMMRGVDALLAIPRLPIAIVILAVANLRGQNIQTIVLALAIAGWMVTARLVRGHVVALKTRDYVRAARALGASWPQIARRHIAPNSIGVVVIAVLLELPAVVLGEAFLAVLGLGPAPPTATWGNLAFEGWHFFRTWQILVASAAIALFAVAANVLADAFHEAVDPRRRRGARWLV